MEHHRSPLLAQNSPLDAASRELISDLIRREDQLMAALPSDDPLDPKRRRRVELTRPEIGEQPDTIRNTLAQERGRIREAAERIARNPPSRVYMVGCGDSLATMVAVRTLLETLVGVPFEPVQALDFAYYHSAIAGPDTLVVSLSSSGTTTRTVEAVMAAKSRGARTLALSNTPNSALIDISEHGLVVHAERKGWPTQSSTAAMALLCQLGFEIARAAGRMTVEAEALQGAFADVPSQIADVISTHEEAIADVARCEAQRSLFLFAAGGPTYAAAMFGAAKVKECSPDHALAINIEEYHHYNSQKTGDPLILIAPAGASVKRAHETALQGKHWGGRVHSIVTGDETLLDAYSDTVLRLQAVPELLAPFAYSVPVQLFAYHLAMEKFRLAEGV